MKIFLGIIPAALVLLCGCASFESDLKKADSGDAKAQYRVGRAYLEGDGIPVDPEKSADYWGRAAKAGDPDTQQNLWRLLARKDVPAIPADSVLSLLRSADAAIVEEKGEKEERKALAAGVENHANTMLSALFLSGRTAEAEEVVSAIEKVLQDARDRKLILEQGEKENTPYYPLQMTINSYATSNPIASTIGLVLTLPLDVVGTVFWTVAKPFEFVVWCCSTDEPPKKLPIPKKQTILLAQCRERVAQQKKKENADKLFAQAELAEQKKDYEKAIALFQQAEQLQHPQANERITAVKEIIRKTEADKLFAQAEQSEQKKDYDKAIALFQQAEQLQHPQAKERIALMREKKRKLFTDNPLLAYPVSNGQKGLSAYKNLHFGASMPYLGEFFGLPQASKGNRLKESFNIDGIDVECHVYKASIDDILSDGSKRQIICHLISDGISPFVLWRIKIQFTDIKFDELLEKYKKETKQRFSVTTQKGRPLVYELKSSATPMDFDYFDIYKQAVANDDNGIRIEINQTVDMQVTYSSATKNAYSLIGIDLDSPRYEKNLRELKELLFSESSVELVVSDFSILRNATQKTREKVIQQRFQEEEKRKERLHF